MTDVFTRRDRSRIMSLVRNRHTRPELLVRSILHRMGFRFSLHRRDLPGSPDIVLPAKKTVVFVHGCFWHSHRGCRRSKLPATHIRFWRKKLSLNLERDRRAQKELRSLGWRVAVVWECELKMIDRVRRKLAKFMHAG